MKHQRVRVSFKFQLSPDSRLSNDHILNISRELLSQLGYNNQIICTTKTLKKGKKKVDRRKTRHMLSSSRPPFKKTETFSIFFFFFFFTLLHSFLSIRQKSSLHQQVARGRRQLHRSLPIRTDHHPSPVVREQLAFFLAKNTSVRAWRLP